jgi:hypothetical protein
MTSAEAVAHWWGFWKSMCTHFYPPHLSVFLMRDDHRSVATGEISKAVARGLIKTARNPQ